jgi:pyruvate/2-oxoglutarate dehydrogenase complex dihydrolipoamide acyltransferase (E2) component
MMYLALSYDHRIVADARHFFLVRVKEGLRTARVVLVCSAWPTISS